MAKRKVDYLKPYKQRPQTSSLVANRLIGASLGIRMPKEKLDIEKNKLKLAKGLFICLFISDLSISEINNLSLI